MLELMQKQKQIEDWNDWSKYAFVVRYLGQWEKVPTIEDLIGKSPFSVPEIKINEVDEWKQWAKEKGLKAGR